MDPCCRRFCHWAQLHAIGEVLTVGLLPQRAPHVSLLASHRLSLAFVELRFPPQETAVGADSEVEP